MNNVTTRKARPMRHFPGPTQFKEFSPSFWVKKFFIRSNRNPTETTHIYWYIYSVSIIYSSFPYILIYLLQRLRKGTANCEFSSAVVQGKGWHSGRFWLSLQNLTHWSGRQAREELWAWLSHAAQIFLEALWCENKHCQDAHVQSRKGCGGMARCACHLSRRHGSCSLQQRWPCLEAHNVWWPFTGWCSHLLAALQRALWLVQRQRMLWFLSSGETDTHEHLRGRHTCLQRVGNWCNHRHWLDQWPGVPKQFSDPVLAYCCLSGICCNRLDIQWHHGPCCRTDAVHGRSRHNTWLVGWWVHVCDE